MTCCGRPHEDDLNSCPRRPEHVVVGTQLKAGTNEPVLLVLTCCGAHLPAVKKYQAQWEDALVGPIEAYDVVMSDLGPEAWVPTMAEAV